VRSVTDSETYSLLGDEPHVGDSDPFGFDKIAEELARLILRSHGSSPFTIGIEANWGRGKSSLMAQLDRRLRRNALAEDGEPVEIRTVSYNAWTAEGADVLEGLVKAVLDAIDPSILRRAMRNNRIWALVRVGTVAAASVLRLGNLADRVWDTLSVDARARNQINDVVRGAMEDWRSRLVEQAHGPGRDGVIVVFIDDLDRCSPSSVLRVFEAIKLYLNAPGFVFVIGYDESVISEAVVEEKEYSRQVTGRDYIEKIVQIVFRVPRPSEEQAGELLNQYLRESRTAELFDEAERRLVIERNGRNPRRIKRFINRFILDYRLDDASADLDAELLIKLLILETYFPDFARLFDDAAEKNPVREFLDYLEARAVLRQGGPGAVDDDAVKEVFDSYGEPPRPQPAEALQRLEELVPEPFVRLVRDPHFVSLMRTLSNAEDQNQLLAKVQRRQELRTTLTEPSDSKRFFPPGAVKGGEAGLLDGARIVWFDDRPENNAAIVDWLRREGATVYEATSSPDAEKLLRSRPDLLISDIGRGPGPNEQEAGFDDLERFRASRVYGGPAIFFTSRVTGARRQRAADLGAEIASGGGELRNLVLTALAARDTAVDRDQPELVSA
jgi:CheY-like chemotaxis protein